MENDGRDRFTIAFIAVEVRVPMEWKNPEQGEFVKTKLKSIKRRIYTSVEEFRNKDVQIEIR